MILYINHCYITKTFQDPKKSYDARYLVIIEDNVKEEAPDFHNLLITDIFFHNKEKEEEFKAKGFTIERPQKDFTNRLKPEVIEWLNDNIKDKNKNEKGYGIGTDNYNSKMNHEFKILFYRKNDALLFIKTHSVYKKPTMYFDYFKNIKKVLNKETQKLELINSN